MPINTLRQWLRRRPWWLAFREIGREGWGNAARRVWYSRKILRTPPVRTSRTGPVEIRVLTWRRDWLNLLWALKSFYHFAEVDLPLYIHDGGLLPHQAELLRQHFPDATFVPMADATVRIAEEFERRGLKRCLEYRKVNVSTCKLFDFFAFSTAEHLIVIDSDIVFFKKPELLLVPPEGVTVNRYNEDVAHWYSMEVDELQAAFGIRPPDKINSGLALIRRESIDFDKIDRWLENPKMFENKWVTEQTLHALCSTIYGVELLPKTYLVDVEPGLSPDLVCKHYPGFFRIWLYREGMGHLVRTGFLKALRRKAKAQAHA